MSLGFLISVFILLTVSDIYNFALLVKATRIQLDEIMTSDVAERHAERLTVNPLTSHDDESCALCSRTSRPAPRQDHL